MLKDKLYNYFVRTNGRVWYEYERYVRENIEEHRLHRLKHLRLLLKLNWFYRVKKGNTPYLYWDVPLNPICGNYDTKALGHKATKENYKLPYIGVESEISNRGKEVWWVLQTRQYDVVSFDVFDTLVLRPFQDASDVFTITGKRLGICGFHKIRVEAERKVRAKRFEADGIYDVSIHDIYCEISELTGLDVEKGISTELQVEMDYCFANPFMKKVFDMLLGIGKKIICVSDMYFPHDDIVKILTHCGYQGIHEIFVSCDYGVTKRSGELYEIVNDAFKDMNVVHIGDNFCSDIEAAKQQGITTKYYKSCNEIGKKYRADGMSNLIGSLYSGIVNARLHSGGDSLSACYEYGFIYGGIYVFGFCNWLAHNVVEKGIEKVLFLTRDGDIFEKVFRKLYPQINTELFFWSRIANLKATAEFDHSVFFNRQIINKVNQRPHIKIYDVFKSIGLEKIVGILENEGINTSDFLLDDNVDEVVKICKKYWAVIEEDLKVGERYTLTEIEKAIENRTKIAIVDVGWLGSGPLGIKKVIKGKISSEIEVFCFLAAAGHTDRSSNICDIYSEDIIPYIFAENMNRIHFSTHISKNRGMDNAFFELFTQATIPAFAGFDSRGKRIFDFPAVENYSKIQQIHEGIIDFCDTYNEVTRYDVYLRNISGYDAYCPFRMVCRAPKLLDFIFGDFLYSFEAGVNVANGEKPHSLGDEMRRRGLI